MPHAAGHALPGDLGYRDFHGRVASDIKQASNQHQRACGGRVVCHAMDPAARGAEPASSRPGDQATLNRPGASGDSGC